MPKRLYFCEMLFLIGSILLIISQFTGLYYTFDENNTYSRSSGYIICYIIPILILLIQNSLVIQYRKKLGFKIAFPLFLFSVVPVIASFLQLFAYGISLINMSVVGMSIIVYVFVLIDLGETLQKSKLHIISLES